MIYSLDWPWTTLTAGFHQATVYNVVDGTTREQVTADPNSYVNADVPGPLDGGDIGDTNNWFALRPSARAVDWDVVDRNDSLRWELTLNEPGRYLVICTIRSYFLDPDPRANGVMFGFVVLR